MYSITPMDIYLSRAICVAGVFFPVLSILVLLCVYSKNVKEIPKGKYFERFFKSPYMALIFLQMYMIKFVIFSKRLTCGYSFIG